MKYKFILKTQVLLTLACGSGGCNSESDKASQMEKEEFDPLRKRIEKNNQSSYLPQSKNEETSQSAASSKQGLENSISPEELEKELDNDKYYRLPNVKNSISRQHKDAAEAARKKERQKIPTEEIDSLPREIRDAKIKVLVVGMNDSGKSQLISYFSGDKIPLSPGSAKACTTQKFSAHKSKNFDIVYVEAPSFACEHDFTSYHAEDLSAYYDGDIAASGYKNCYDSSLRYQNWPKDLSYNLILHIVNGQGLFQDIRDEFLLLNDRPSIKKLESRTLVLLSKDDLLRKVDRKERLENFKNSGIVKKYMDPSNAYTYGFYNKDEEEDEFEEDQPYLTDFEKQIYARAKQNEPCKIDMYDGEHRKEKVNETRERMGKLYDMLENHIKDPKRDRVVAEIEENLRKTVAKYDDSQVIEIIFKKLQKDRIVAVLNSTMETIGKFNVKLNDEKMKKLLSNIEDFLESTDNFVWDRIRDSEIQNLKKALSKAYSSENLAVKKFSEKLNSGKLALQNKYSESYYDEVDGILKNLAKEIIQKKKVIKHNQIPVTDLIEEEYERIEAEMIKEKIKKLSKSNLLEKEVNSYIAEVSKSIRSSLLKEAEAYFGTSNLHVPINEKVLSYKDLLAIADKCLKSQIESNMQGLEIDESIIEKFSASFGEWQKKSEKSDCGIM